MIGLLIILLILLIMIGLRILVNNPSVQFLREIPSLTRLNQAIDQTVETGRQLHITLGHGGIIGIPGATGFIGLKLLQKTFRTLAMSDSPPSASTGDALLDLLAAGEISTILPDDENPYSAGRSPISITGLTPNSYAVGTLPLILDENVSVNLLIGSFGSEIGLMADAAEQMEGLTTAGTENITAQAVLTAFIPDSLIGEEVYSAGAYLQAGKMHFASLQTQDICRFGIIIILILGSILKLIGIL